MSIFLNKLLHRQKYALSVSRLYLLPHSTLNFFLIGKGRFELLAARGGQGGLVLFLTTSRMFSIQKHSCPVSDVDGSDSRPPSYSGYLHFRDFQWDLCISEE